MKPISNLIFILLIFYSLRSYSQNLNIDNKDTTNTYALVVGISSYQNIKPLKYADDDAYLFTQFLVNQNICKKNNIHLLIDSIATTANFYRDLGRILIKAKKGDRVFIYFAGHGDVENDLESGFLLTYNCEKNNYPATSIDISMLERHINALVNKNINVVMITDACRSGNLVGGLNGTASTISSLSKGFKNVVKLVSCQPNQLSQEKIFATGGHGIFTYYLINGLSGLADKNNDDAISLREIDTYLDQVSLETDQSQIPKVDGDPTAFINQYDPQIKFSLSTNNLGSYLSYRTYNSISDTMWLTNPYYRDYLDKREKDKLVSDFEPSCLSIIKMAREKDQPDDMLKEMSLDLIASLEDKSQMIINKLLIGNFSNQSQIEIRDINIAIRYLDVVLDLMNKDNLRRNEILLKQYYFKCLSATVRRSFSGMSIYVQKLTSLDSLLPNQSWVKNLLGLTYYYLGQNYSSLDNLNKSKSYLLQAVKITPSWSTPWNNLGLIYEALGDYDSSILSFQKSIALDDKNGDSGSTALSNLGNVYLDLKDTLLAKEYYIKAISLNKNNPYSYIYLASFYENQSNYIKAEEYYLKAIQLDSLVSEYWNLLSECYIKMNNTKKLPYSISKIIATDSSDFNNWNTSITLYNKLGKSNLSKSLLKKAIVHFNHKSRTFISSYEWQQLGLLYHYDGNIDLAIKQYLHAINIDKDDYVAFYNLARAKYDLKQFAEADSIITVALDINPIDNSLQLLKGQISYELADDSISVINFKSVLNSDSTSATAYWYLGKISLDNNEFEKSVDYFNKLCQIDKSDIYSLKWLGIAKVYLSLSQNLPIFRFELENVSKIMPSIAESWWYLGCIAYLEGDKKKALLYLNRSFSKKYYDLEILEFNDKLLKIKDDKEFKSLFLKINKEIGN